MEVVGLIDEVNIFYEYSGNSIDFLYKGDRDLLEKIIASRHRIEAFEQPDMVLLLEDKVLAIEHFEFDASSSSKKGSLDKRKLAERNREFDKLIIDSDISEEPLVVTNSVDCIYSADNYIRNFMSAFEKHLLKVSDYKTHLINENIVKHADDIIMCFFIVDTTPLGCYYEEDGPKSFIAFQVVECLELISRAKEIDCLFFGYFDGRKNSLEFISNCPEVVKLTRDIRTIDFRRDEFFTFNTKESRFCTKLND